MDQPISLKTDKNAATFSVPGMANREKDMYTDEEIINDLLPRKFGKSGIIWTTFLVIVCAIGLFSYIRQLEYGLVVTGLRDYALWGIYISNFVFFVAISLVAALVTAVLRLSGVHWSTPLTRIAEIIALSAITFAALIIIVDMGRPERLVNLFVFVRLQSPIIWDVVVITTYFFISAILLYLSLLPDMKILLRSNSKKGLNKFYGFLGSFWKGSSMQVRLSNQAINVICIAIIPISFCIQIVDSWLFATTYRPGWDSTNFGAYFLAGAFLAGAGAISVAMYVFQKFYRLEKYITDVHFDKMGRIVVMLAALYLYFHIDEYFTPLFKMKKPEAPFLNELFTGAFAPAFWFVIFAGMIIPMVVLMFKRGRKPFPMFICGVMIVIGAWLKRYLIVTPTLLHPFLPMHNVPESYKHYFPSWDEMAIACGSLAGALLIITIFARIFPIIPIQETLIEQHEKQQN